MSALLDPSSTQQPNTNSIHNQLTTQRITHPIITYLTYRVSFQDHLTGTNFKWNLPALTQMVTMAISKLYGFIGSVTINFEVLSYSAEDETMTLGVEDYAYNSLRAALTYYTMHNTVPISIRTVAQGSTLDQCVLYQEDGQWFNDIIFQD